MILGNQTNRVLGNVYFIAKLRLNFIFCHCLNRIGITTIILGGLCKFYYKIKGNRFLGQVLIKTQDQLYVAERLKPPLKQ